MSFMGFRGTVHSVVWIGTRNKWTMMKVDHVTSTKEKRIPTLRTVPLSFELLPPFDRIEGAV